MAKGKALADLKVGSSGKILEIKDFKNKLRLEELGFTPSTKIFVLHENIGKTVYAYGVKGTVIALRKDDVKNILVEEDKYVWQNCCSCWKP